MTNYTWYFIRRTLRSNNPIKIVHNIKPILLQLPTDVVTFVMGYIMDRKNISWFSIISYINFVWRGVVSLTFTFF